VKKRENGTRTKKQTDESKPEKAGGHSKPVALDDPELFFNRELTWLAFNERVLNEAGCKTNPLLERLKFTTIFASNLDEFFMVRLSGLLRLVEKEGQGISTSSRYPDESDPEETLDEVAITVRRLVKHAAQLLAADILPALRQENIFVCKPDDLSRAEQERVDEYFEQQVFPVLTPLAVDPAHPFPYLANLSLYLAVNFHEMGDNGEPLLAFVEVPAALGRLVPVSSRGRKHRFVLLEDIIRQHLDKLFPWTQVSGAYVFRVTRNLDYQLLEGEVKDLMKSIELELKDRAQKIVVRLEVEQGFPLELKNRLRMALELDHSDVYEIPELLNIRDLGALTKLDVDPALKDPPFNPRTPPRLAEDRDIFDIIRERDVLLHHPYDSFVSVLEFLQQAAADPNTLAIKQTLYRTGGDSPIIDALVKAAENGKQVTAVVELKARFDEANNIVWARRLERAGAHVVFGFVGLKTHAKCTLVVRREGGHLQRYVHLSTGNYNSSTAKLYTDLGHLTADAAITNDVGSLFNLLTGFNILGNDEKGRKPSRMPEFEKIQVAPFRLRDHIISLIEAEKRLHTPDNPGHIIVKMNALTDPKLVVALYKASQKGVRVDLIVRGMCVLRPGMPGVSENIRVVSIIDRFLEHSRILWLKNGGHPKMYLGSADFMPRNMDRRIELFWAVDEPSLQAKVTGILHTFLLDNTKSHVMQPDGSYVLQTPGKDKAFRAQDRFIELARAEGVKSIAYDDAIRSIDALGSQGNMTEFQKADQKMKAAEKDAHRKKEGKKN
jgi:polyphosphate kinase